MNAEIVVVDGPCSLTMWLCPECQKDLGEAWFLVSAKKPPHPLPCDRRGIGTCKGDSE